MTGRFTTRGGMPPSKRYHNWRTLPVEGAGEDIRAGLRAIAYGIAAGLLVALFIVVRH